MLVILFGSLAAILVFLSWVKPLTGDRWLRPLEQRAAVIARHRGRVILALGLAVIVSRLALLPLVPVPLPAIHDEFSYLLAADTFAHGRLTNPPHPMSVFFDTFHVLQRPTYASKYPPAPGAAMAIGQVLGHPWIGVLLSMAAMVMAMTWMLQGWFPPVWGLLGGVLVLLRLGLFNQWGDSYYNGSVATIGAALVLGAYPRIFHSDAVKKSAIMGTGAVILACSRPFEGLVFCIPVAVATIVGVIRRRNAGHSFSVARKSLFPAMGVVIAGMIFLGYYNYRVTNHPLLFPYVLYHHEYFGNYPIFAWQKVTAPLDYDNPQFEQFFNVWHRESYPLTWDSWQVRAVGTLLLSWRVLPGFVLAVPLVLLPRVVRDRRMRFPLIQLAICGAALLSVVWFQPHYTAPIAATFFVLLVQSMRHLRLARLDSRPVGLFLTRLTVVLLLVGVALKARLAEPPPEWARARARMVQQLGAMPGEHLVLVRYFSDHNVHEEWVYNAADINGAKVVWARQIPGRDLGPILRYFNGRHVWVVEPDSDRPQLVEFSGPAKTGPGS